MIFPLAFRREAGMVASSKRRGRASHQEATMTDHTKRSDFEARTHELFDVETMESKGLGWSQERQLVAMVWRACWSGSLTIESINETAKALGHLHDVPNLQEMVTTMARKRMLRSRMNQGRRLYEVNY